MKTYTIRGFALSHGFEGHLKDGHEMHRLVRHTSRIVSTPICIGGASRKCEIIYLLSATKNSLHASAFDKKHRHFGIKRTLLVLQT